MNIFERFNRNSEPMPIQGAARRLKEQANGEMGNVSSGEIANHQQWVVDNIKKAGIEVDMNQLMYDRGLYYRQVINETLDLAIGGGNIAIVLGDCASQIKSILSENDVRERAEMSLNLVHKIVRGEGNKGLAQLKRTIPTAFQPWIGILTNIDQKRPEIIKNISLLDKAVEKSDGALYDAGKILTRTSGSINREARNYDEGLLIQTKIEAATQNAASLNCQLMRAIMKGDEQIGEITNKLLLQREEIAGLCNSALGRNRAMSAVMEQHLKIGGETLGAETLMSINRAVRISAQSNLVVATLPPLLALNMLGVVSSVASISSIWMSYRIVADIQNDPSKSITPSMVKELVRQTVETSRANTEKFIQPEVDGYDGSTTSRSGKNI